MIYATRGMAPTPTFVHPRQARRHAVGCVIGKRFQLAATTCLVWLDCLPGGGGGGAATPRAAPTEGKRMDKILTLLILLLQVVKLVLEYLNR